MGWEMLMYRDPVQWAEIRKRIIKEGASIRQISRETGIDRETIGKILQRSTPPKQKPRKFGNPKLGPHAATICRLLEENKTLPPTSGLSVRAIYQHLQSSESFA